MRLNEYPRSPSAASPSRRALYSPRLPSYRILLRMFLPILLAGLVAVQAPDTAHLVVVATTDVHGYVTDRDYFTGRPFPGGLERAATVVDSLRRRYPGSVVLVDAGDLIQGSPFATYFAREDQRSPDPVIDAMSAMGYDAATPGNHEYNFGIPFMRRALAAAAFPYVSGNTRALPADTLAFPSWVVVQRAGVRVGITGFTTPGVEVWDGDKIKGLIRIDRIAAAAPRVLRGLAGESDVTIALVHSGMDEPSSYDTAGVGPENDAAALARLPVKPDLVIVGHTHRAMADSVLNGVHFVQPKNYAQSVSVVHLSLVRVEGRWKVRSVHADLVPLAGVPPWPPLVRRLAGADQEVARWVAQPIGRAGGPMPAALARAQATPIINFINDVQRRHTGADLSAASAFNLRAGFAPGDIRIADVAALYPYENTLRVVRITGAQLKDYLEQSARYFSVAPGGAIGINPEIPGYNFDIIGGAEYAIDLRLPPGNRIRGLSVHGRPVQPDDRFTLAVNSYRQAGGGGYDMLKGAPVVYDRNENIRDLLIEAIRQRQYIQPDNYASQSWRIVPEEAADAVRRLFTARAEAPVAPLPAAAPAPARDTVLLRIVALNDFHGALLPEVRSWSQGRPAGGIAALKRVMDSLQADCGCAELRLDAGDEMQGSLASNLTGGRTVIQAFNRLGIRAAAIGNHDFDWSVDTLLQRMAESRYVWLSANVVDSVTGARPTWATPWKVLDTGRLKVGVIGYTTPATPSMVRAGLLRGLRFDSGPADIEQAAREMAAQHPDLTVLLAHAGGFCDSLACRGEIIDLARSLDSGTVDAIVSGHTHTIIDTRVRGMPVVQAGSKGGAVAVIDVVRTPVGTTLLRSRLVDVYADSAAPDTATAAWLASLHAQADSVASAPVAALKVPLEHTRGQNALGNLIADANRNAARADFGLVNNGGIRGDLPAGVVTWGELYEVEPFQNAIVRMQLSGAEVRRLMEQIVASGRPAFHISGARVVWDSTRPAGRRVREIRLVTGRRLDDRSVYTVGLADYLAGERAGSPCSPAGRPRPPG